MSYILDALKRADTERERERGHVPGLHSQNLPGGTLGRDRRGKTRPVPRRWGLLAMLVLGIVVLAFVAWRFFPLPSADAEPDVQASAISSPSSVPPANPGQVPAAGAASVPVSPDLNANRPPELPILAPPPPAPPAQPTPPAAAAAATAPAPRVASSPTGAPAQAPTAAPAPAVPAVPAAAAPGRAESPVRRFAELPADFRAQLPQVNISGSTYSSNPAQRTLIANGKMVQEGGEIAPGLQLESIGPRSAVLNYQGTRYSIGY